MIKINIEKRILENGEKRIELISCKGLDRWSVPSMYRNNNKPSTFFENDLIFFTDHNETLDNSWTAGVGVSQKTFQKIMTHIKKSGDNLMQVNAHLSELRKTWHGTKTYKI